MAGVYRGRFAPSPTGPLHFGSLLSAVASYLDARQNDGTWLIRIEDVDGTRCSEKFQVSILNTLASYGLVSDETILIQSQRYDLYQAHLERLIEQQLAYPCNCTRASLSVHQGMHPVRCDSTTDHPHSWRAQCDQGRFQFIDPIQGSQSFDLASPVNHPVLKRKDGYFSYQLAVVVDDHLQGINEIVRGADLLDTTGQQLWLYRALQWQAPKLCHLPLIVNERGDKISKQNHAKAIDNGCPNTLTTVLQYLGFQDIPSDYRIQQLLEWATPLWQRQSLSHNNLTVAPKDLSLIR